MRYLILPSLLLVALLVFSVFSATFITETIDQTEAYLDQAVITIICRSLTKQQSVLYKQPNIGEAGSYFSAWSSSMRTWIKYQENWHGCFRMPTPMIRMIF